MNANEARELSYKNASKAAEKDLEQAIDYVNDAVKQAAIVGEYAASVTIIENNLWEDHHLMIRLRNHFREKGYIVEFRRNLRDETIINIAWDAF
ncbi:hypothetical protein [Virgibacillus oceani]|uniref:Uncharacterized protein n=1 Tax=Virgibacillus oceani TaxID=1479511 RepID=A0A917H268_9BACI|nr:hypothetical protein [Virgibacillus oceani]GGG64456.1 hypothetical protein GCM10011398_05050 [Virgibacillus oceani]